MSHWFRKSLSILLKMLMTYLSSSSSYNVRCTNYFGCTKSSVLFVDSQLETINQFRYAHCWFLFLRLASFLKVKIEWLCRLLWWIIYKSWDWGRVLHFCLQILLWRTFKDHRELVDWREMHFSWVLPLVSWASFRRGAIFRKVELPILIVLLLF